MSELTTERNPQILVNGAQREPQREQQQEQQQEPQQEQQQEPQQEQQQEPQQAAAVEEQVSVGLGDECSEDGAAAENEMQAKMQSVLQQVRDQIRSRVGMKAPKSSILELVQRVKDRETEKAQVNGEPEGRDVNSREERRAEMSTDKSDDVVDLELCAFFEEKLEASEKALRNEFEQQISQVRKEMQAYTDKALKDLEWNMQGWKSHTLQQTHPKEQQEGRGLDRKQKPAAAPTLASRRGRVLTRTMTTIIPKTCAPVIIGPRAKSETLTYSKGQSSRLVPRDPALYSLGNKPYQSRKPLPPPCPPLRQRKKPVCAKAGN